MLGKEPRTATGGLKQTVTRVTLITIVIRMAKKKSKAPCPDEMGDGCVRQARRDGGGVRGCAPEIGQ